MVGILLWIVADLSWLRGSQEVAEHYARQDQQGDSDHEIADLCSLRPETSRMECLVEKIEARNKWEIETRDHQAQEAMARWAKGATIAGLIGAIAAIYGLRLLRLTWKETQRAANIARDVGERQVRAYLAVASVKVDPKAEPVTYLEVHNFGQSPARNVRSWIHTWCAEYPLKSELPNPVDVSGFGQSTKPPGLSSWHDQPHGNKLNAYTRKQMALGKAAFYIYGRIEYEDVFGQKRWTNFRFFHDGSVAGWDGRVKSYPTGNDSN